MDTDNNTPPNAPAVENTETDAPKTPDAPTVSVPIPDVPATPVTATPAEAPTPAGAPPATPEATTPPTQPVAPEDLPVPPASLMDGPPTADEPAGEPKPTAVSDMSLPKEPFKTPEGISQEPTVNLNEKSPGLKAVKVAIGWDVVEEEDSSYDVDLDVSAFLLSRSDQVRFDTDFIFYNNLTTEEGVITHHGDNVTGEGDGDNEVIDVNLEKLSFDIEKIVFSLSIHNCDERHQNFTMVKNAFIRIMHAETGEELMRYNLEKDDVVTSKETSAFLFGEVFREAIVGGWAFKPLSKMADNGLYGIAHGYGVNVAEP